MQKEVHLKGSTARDKNSKKIHLSIVTRKHEVSAYHWTLKNWIKDHWAQAGRKHKQLIKMLDKHFTIVVVVVV